MNSKRHTRFSRTGFLTVLILFTLSDSFGSDQPVYQWPTNASRALSGVFGEMRSRRFHAGLDIRTRGTTGFPVFAVSDGHISRIQVSSSGYGKVLYLKLKDGHTAVYAHLQTFTPELDSLIRIWQTESQTYSLKRYFPPGRFPVVRGDILGTTGDTGSIGGPHLHFEVRSPDGLPLNPLESHYQIRDTVRPKIRSLAFIPLETDTRVGGYFSPVLIALQDADQHSFYTIADTIPVFGSFGLAVNAVDLIDGQPFTYGIYKLTMSVADSVWYETRYSSYPFSEDPLVYTERNYALYREGLGKFYQLFTQFGSQNLDFIKIPSPGFTDSVPGVTPVRVTVADISGNTAVLNLAIRIEAESEAVIPVESMEPLEKQFFGSDLQLGIQHFVHGIQFSVNGWENDFPEAVLEVCSEELSMSKTRSGMLVSAIVTPELLDGCHQAVLKSNTGMNTKYWNIETLMTRPGSSFRMKSDWHSVIVSSDGSSFYDDALIWLNKTQAPIPSGYRQILGPVEIGPDLIPYKNPLQIEFLLDEITQQAAIYAFDFQKKSWYYLDSEFSADSLRIKTEVLSGEIFAVLTETGKPEITNLYPEWGVSLTAEEMDRISFNIDDQLTGIDGETDIAVQLDGRNFIPEYNSYRKAVLVLLDDTLSVGPHTLQIEGTDRIGNTARIRNTFYITE